MSPILLLAAMSSVTSTNEITFTGPSGFTLYGEMLKPEGEGPFPCVLLLPGSGPTDRDGNQQPYLVTDVLKQIALRLQSDGIATFRFDKRPVHRYKEAWPKDVSEFSEFFSFENHVTDVEAAYVTMKVQDGIDPEKLAILGHSEGGLFTCWQAERLEPRAIVLVGTAGETLEGTIRYQIGRNVALAPVSEEEKKKIIDSNEAAMAAIIKEHKLPVDIHPGLKALYNPTALSLMHSYLTIDPKDSLSRYKGNVLIVNGEKDIQIRADHDAVMLEKCVASRETGTHETYIVPGASHCLKHDLSEQDPGFTGPIDPSALQKISDWLKVNLTGTMATEKSS